MFNQFETGYKNGYRDALEGKEKSYVNFSIKDLLSSKAQESYSQGYDSGFAKGRRELNAELENEVEQEMIHEVNESRSI